MNDILPLTGTTSCRKWFSWFSNSEPAPSLTGSDDTDTSPQVTVPQIYVHGGEHTPFTPTHVVGIRVDDTYKKSVRQAMFYE